MRITNKEDYAIISNHSELKDYLENKVKTMSEEYNVDYFESIGCFVILDDEKEMPSEEELEFSEEIAFEREFYMMTGKIFCGVCGKRMQGNCSAYPYLFTSGCRNFTSCQFLGNIVRCHTVNKQFIDKSYNFCFFRNNFRQTVFTFFVSEKFCIGK